MPTMVIAEKVKRNGHSIFNVWTSPENPIKEFKAIITKEVPTAFFMDSPAHSTKAGTYKNPPPAPISPVINPIMAP